MNDEIMTNIFKLLHEILEKPEKRLENINRFQNMIWDAKEPMIEDKILWDDLCNLAYDIDYYEPDIDERKEEPSYYGESRLQEEVHAILNKHEPKGF